MIMTCKQLLPFSRLQSQNKNNLLIAWRLIEMAASQFTKRQRFTTGRVFRCNKKINDKTNDLRVSVKVVL